MKITIMTGSGENLWREIPDIRVLPEYVYWTDGGNASIRVAKSIGTTGEELVETYQEIDRPVQAMAVT